MSDQPPENASTEQLHAWVTARVAASTEGVVGQTNNVTTLATVSAMVQQTLTSLQQQDVLPPVVWTRFSPEDPGNVQILTFNRTQLQLGRYGCTEAATGLDHTIVALNEETEQLQLQDGRQVSGWDPDFQLWYRPPFRRFFRIFRDGVRSLLRDGLSFGRTDDVASPTGPPQLQTQRFRSQMQCGDDLVDLQVDKRLQEQVKRGVLDPVARRVY